MGAQSGRKKSDRSGVIQTALTNARWCTVGGRQKGMNHPPDAETVSQHWSLKARQHTTTARTTQENEKTAIPPPDAGERLERKTKSRTQMNAVKG